jgi:2,3-bisphosphoglycerate-independent phosphoglycerate mutase
MKYVILVPDGASDRPVKERGGATPLQAARLPNMDFIARHGRGGTALTIPEGMPPGSDVANFSILGYHPRRYYTGRGPLEAASMGVELGEEEVAFRCNLVTVEDGVLADYSAGHITSREAALLIRELDGRLGDGDTRWRAGVGYRHLLVLRGEEYLDSRCFPPHDVVGRRVEEVLPAGPGSERLRFLMHESLRILEEHPVNIRRKREGARPANMIWPWGQGKKPSLPSFQEKYAVKGAVITAVDLIKGLGASAGMSVVTVPGATGYHDTDYRAKALYALKSLYHHDLVFIHVEAPDEAGHEGDWEAKVKSLENIDSLILGTLFSEFSRRGEDFAVLVIPDHATPLEVRTHVADPVPFAYYFLEINPDGCVAFNEQGVQAGSWSRLPAWELLDRFLGEAGSAGRTRRPRL